MKALSRLAVASLGLGSIILVCGSPAGAASVTLTPNRDNSLFADGADRSCAIGPLFCGQTGAFGLRRALIAFDVAGNIPPGSTVTSVQVEVTVTMAGLSSQASDEFKLHRLTTDWGEKASECTNGAGGVADDGDATWTQAHFPSNAWGQVGGDFSATSSQTTAMPVFGPATFASTAGLVADVQAWLDQPSTNFGWIILGNEVAARTARMFSSREGATPPSLTVEFTAPPLTPPAVPDGATGSPVRLTKVSPGGADLSIAWDGALCGGTFGHHIVYGTSAGFPAVPLGTYGLAGSVCAVGTSPPYLWSGSPDPAVLDPGKKLIWMLVLANDPAATEGSWGRNSLSQERNGPGTDGCSNQCGILDKSVTNTCGIGF
jgi:hypothetical protein